MSPERRTKLLLAGLAVLLVIFGWRRLGPSLFGGGEVIPAENRAAADDEMIDRDGGATSRTAAARARRARSGDAPTDRVVALHLDQLNPSAGQYQAGRNPFAYFLPPPPPPPRPPGPTKEELEERRRAEAEAAARAAAAALARASAEPPRPQPPPVPYTYLGRFGPRNRPIAVLAEGEAIHNVLLGDVLDGKFRLVVIGYESVELEYVDFPDVPAARLPVGTEGT